MLPARSLRARTFALVLAVVTFAAAAPIPVHHHADHGDEVVHLEHDHGGHGGLLEQDEARVPTSPGPQAIGTFEAELPRSPLRHSALQRADDFLSPLGRAPPPGLPRAPPLSS